MSVHTVGLWRLRARGPTVILLCGDGRRPAYSEVIAEGRPTLRYPSRES